MDKTDNYNVILLYDFYYYVKTIYFIIKTNILSLLFYSYNITNVYKQCNWLSRQSLPELGGTHSHNFLKRCRWHQHHEAMTYTDLENLCESSSSLTQHTSKLGHSSNSTHWHPRFLWTSKRLLKPWKSNSHAFVLWIETTDDNIRQTVRPKDQSSRGLSLSLSVIQKSAYTSLRNSSICSENVYYPNRQGVKQYPNYNVTYTAS